MDFTPHPKTLTSGGDLDHFAAQGFSPTPYAIAELLDNSLQATWDRHVRHARPKPSQFAAFSLHRGQAAVSDNDYQAPSSTAGAQIHVIISAESSGPGFVCVADNGVGMTAERLSSWAVMNLGINEREQTGQGVDGNSK